MSADPWSKCPKCIVNFKQDPELSAAVEKIKSLGGKVELQVPGLKNTLRQDYEFYLNPDTQKFEVSFHAECTVCRWKHSFNHTEILKI